jgi:hypothetical protein
MRFWAIALLGVGCAETATDPAAKVPAPETTTTNEPQQQVAFDIDIWKDESAGCPVDPDAGPPPEETDAAAPKAAFVDVVPAVRAHVRACYDELLASSPEAQGQLVEQVWLAPNGDVCNVRPTMRIGLPPSASACVEKMLKGAKFENVRSPLYVPLTYVQKRRGAAWGAPSRIANLHTCGKSVSVPTEATFSYASDDQGKVTDLKVDPWKGDQGALECAANAVTAAPHAAGTSYIARLRFHP